MYTHLLFICPNLITSSALISILLVELSIFLATSPFNAKISSMFLQNKTIVRFK